MSQAPTCPPPGSVKLPPPPPPPPGYNSATRHLFIEERRKDGGLPVFDINMPIPDVKPPKPELKTVWICGRMTTKNPGYWELKGIFELESHAVLVCHDDMHFIAPVILGEELPNEIFELPGIRNPWRDKK